MSRARFPAGGRAGFTLLELLLATAVGAGVLLAALAFGQANMNGARIGAERAQEYRRAARLRERLRRDLANACYTGAAIGGYFSGSSAAGADARGEVALLRLTTTAERTLAGEVGADVVLVEYRLTPEGTLRRAVRRDLLATVWKEIEGVELMDGVAGVEVEFYDGSSWIGEWDAETSGELPHLVAVRLRWRDEGEAAGRPPFELIVPVRFDGNEGGAS